MRLRSPLLLLAPLLVPLAIDAQAPVGSRGDERYRAPEPFQSWLGYPLGEQDGAEFPQSIAAADLDGDGVTDVVAAHWPNDAGLSVALGDGAGGFEPIAFHPLSAAARKVAIADLDGDGSLDLVAPLPGANYTGAQVAVLLGRGDGTFGPASTYGGGAGAVGVAVADLDGDGHLDVATADYGSFGAGSRVSVLRGDGAGGLAGRTTHAVGAAPWDLVAADLDGDGRPDLAVAREKQKLALLFNTGSGFGTYVEHTALSYFNTDIYPSVACGDVDGDGDLDLAYSSTRATSAGLASAAVFHNDGAGGLAAPIGVPLETSFTDSGGVELELVDLGGDPLPELVAAKNESGWAWVENVGGAFGAVHTHLGGELVTGLAVADVDRDGVRDVLTSAWASLELTVHRNVGAPGFHEPPRIRTSYAAGSFDAGDVDGDGDLDVLVGAGFGSSYSTAIQRNDGAGAFAPPEAYTASRAPLEVKLRDLDGDGDLDQLYASGSPPYDFHFRRNDGTGGFGAEVTVPVGTCGNGEAEAYDVDGDGDLDVLLTEYGGGPGCTPNLYLSRNDGGASFQPPVAIPTIGRPNRVAAGDLDGDGVADLVLTTAISVEVLLADGAGGYLPAFALPGDWGAQRVALADLDGDGNLDVVTCNFGDLGSGGESMDVHLGRGDGSFDAPTTYPGSNSPVVGNEDGLSVTDVDGDGDLDVAVGNFGSNDLSLWRNRGDGRFEPRLRVGVGAEPADTLVADFDGDLVPDVLGLGDARDLFGLDQHLVLVRATGTGWAQGLASWSSDPPAHAAPAGLAVRVDLGPGAAGARLYVQARLVPGAGDEGAHTPWLADLGGRGAVPHALDDAGRAAVQLELPRCLAALPSDLRVEYRTLVLGADGALLDLAPPRRLGR